MKENTGPTVEEMFASLPSGQASILTELAGIRKRLISNKKAVAALNTRLNAIDKLLLTISEKTSQIQTLEDKVKAFDQVIMKQNDKLTDLEDRSRRSNLIVFDVKEQDDEDDQVLRKAVIEDIFSKKLKQSCMSIARIHRLGKQPG